MGTEQQMTVSANICAGLVSEVPTGVPNPHLPLLRRLSIEHDDLGFMEQAASLLGFASRFVQLDSGRNPSRMELLDGGGLSVVRLVFSRNTFISGPKPSGRVFCNLTLRSAREQPRVYGRPLDAQTLVGFDPQREIHFQAPPGHSFAVLLVDEPLFWQTATMMGRRDLEPDALAANAFHAHPACAPELRRLLDQLFSPPAGLPGDPIAVERTLDQLRNDLLPLLIASIETPHCSHLLQNSRSERLQIVQAVEQLMRERMADPLCLRDFYEAVPTSRRTLVYAFDELFGMPPMRFLRLQRLQAARRQLAAAMPEGTTVMATAQRCGFASASHFSRLYRRHFGESPAQTLLQSQKRLGWFGS